MAKSSKRISSRKPSIFDGIFPESEGESTPSSFGIFLKNFYKPIAVVIAVAILIGVSLYIYKGNESEKLKSTIVKLKAANDLEKLNDPILVAAVKGTPLEFEWRLNRLMKLMDHKEPGAKTIDYEGFIREADDFIDMYPNKLATLQIMFVQASYYAYIGKLDEAKSILSNIIDHPKAKDAYIKIRAEKELAILKDPSSDKDLNENFFKGLSEFATQRLATPTPPPPTPTPLTNTVVPPVVTPTNSNGTKPLPSPSGVGNNTQTPVATTPPPVDLNRPKPGETKKPEPNKPEPKKSDAPKPEASKNP